MKFITNLLTKTPAKARKDRNTALIALAAALLFTVAGIQLPFIEIDPETLQLSEFIFIAVTATIAWVKQLRTEDIKEDQKPRG